MLTQAHPLEIKPLVDIGEDIIGVYSKGHHGAGAEFAVTRSSRPLKHLADEEGFGEVELAELDRSDVSFETWRCIPRRAWGDWWAVSCPPSRAGPGAFPVTVLRLDGAR